MRKILEYGFIAAVSCFLLSCSFERKASRWVCNCEQREKIAVFISSNMKDANNMSDEEMEDVISELTKTAVMINCNQKNVYFDYNWTPIMEKNKLDSCEVIIY